MIRCRLKMLLKERRITHMELSAATGISRVTITALANDKAKGVQYHTLARICEYIGCSVGELLVYEGKENAAQQ